MIPEISIIVPVYNVEPFIEKCINSILNQTFKNFELILVDDGSTDKSGVICRDYSNKDSRIIFISKANSGVSSTRNVALDLAQGKYITFIDSDDSVDIYYLEYLHNLLENDSEADFAICNFKRVDINGNQVGDPLPIFETKHICVVDTIDCYKLTSGLVWGALYRRKALIKKDKILHFNCNIQNSEDNLYTYQVFLNSKKFIRSAKVLYFYLVRENSAFHEEFNPKKISTLDAQRTMIKESKQFPVIKDYIKKYYISNCIKYMELAILKDFNKNDISRIKKHLVKNLIYFLCQKKHIKQKLYYIRLLIQPKRII